MSSLGLNRKKPRGRSERRSLARRRRHARVLKKLHGTAERPRLVVRRSLRHIEAQLVDDEAGVCITGISTRSGEVQANLEDKGSNKSTQSRAAGVVMAERAKAKGVEIIVFDRGGYRYHGRVKAFAEGAREGGLKF